MRSSIILSVVALAASLAVLETQAAGGIKGIQQQLDGSQRLAATKNLRQPPRIPQQQLAIAAPIRAPQPTPTKVGPGQVSPIFASKRPQQPALIPQPPLLPPQAPLPAPAPLPLPPQQQQEIEPEVQQQQQQVEPSEVDANAAAQEGSGALIAPAGPAAAAAESAEEANPRPEPYAFNYAFAAADSITSGSSEREEQQDASGRVTGFYTLKGQDGRDRRVDYVADASGFHATISTNEMGTAPKDAADARWQAQSPSDAQLRAAESATQAARQRALASPQQQQQLSSASGPAKVLASPRVNAPSAFQQQISQLGESSSQQSSIAQLQEPFEQIRQTELNTRARKSRHAPFYLFTV